MTLSLSTIVSNLEILKTFQVGEKPVIDPKTGAITKEDRATMVVFRRWWTGAFKPEDLERTFEEAMPHIKINEIKFDETPTYYQQQREIYDHFPLALDGVRKIAETYKGEAKAATEEKVRKIAERFQKEFEEAKFDIPLAPDSPAAKLQQIQKAATARTRRVIREASQGDLQHQLLERVSSISKITFTEFVGVGTGKAHEKPTLEKQSSFYDPRAAEENRQLLATVLNARRAVIGGK